MNRLTLTIRFLLFCLFFLAGASAVVLAIVAKPELQNYYKNRAMLDQLHQQNEKIKELTDQYAARVELIETEPGILHRFSATTFGQKPQAPDTVFPEVANEKLRAETEKILKTELEPEPIDPIPVWLRRVSDPAIRTALFLSGTALILVTFIFFGSIRQKKRNIE